jgi:molybdate transport system regulatory protein
MSKNPLPLAEVLGHEASDKRIDILRRIGQAGSISEAARGAGVSYKAAWQALETLTNLAGTPLVEKVVGGSGGGGAALTAAGQRVLLAAQAMADARQQVLQQLSDDATTGRAVLALRTSMRNQFPCTVKHVRQAQGQARVCLVLPGGQAIFSRITRVSAQLLGLKAGLDVLALCKATAIAVHGGGAESGTSDGTDGDGHNTVRGEVSRATRGANAEVTLRLPSGIQLVGFAAAGYQAKAGQPAIAVFDESSIVIAAAG